jgi:hypothetical protein
VYPLATRFCSSNVSIAAARYTLQVSLFGRPYQPELEPISAGDIYRLQEFYTRCSTSIRAIAAGKSSSNLLLSGISSPFLWITRDSFVWFTCAACANPSTNHYIRWSQCPHYSLVDELYTRTCIRIDGYCSSRTSRTKRSMGLIHVMCVEGELSAI